MNRRELIVFPDGRIKLSDNTIILPKGTLVIPNKQAEKLLELMKEGGQ